MNHSISYNGEKIFYEIIHKNVKNINIRVRPNGEVFVSCNKNIDKKVVELEMTKKARWIINSRETYSKNIIEFTKDNFQLVDGESILLFGKKLRIINVISDTFKIDHDNNYLRIHREDNRGIKTKFNNWYKKYTREIFEKILNEQYEKYIKHGVKKPSLLIKNMKTRWGTCNITKGIITLNAQLSKIDPYIIEYVICHELTHLLHKNHNADFYVFLTMMVPDWKQREKQLNEIFINL